MRWNPFRITHPWIKVAYVIVGWFGVPWLLRTLLELFAAPELIGSIVDVAWSFADVLLGSRSFRILGEPVVPPRAWWRATGRAPAGFWLGALFLLSSLVVFMPSSAMGILESSLYAGSAVLVGAFYLHSSIRLVRGEATVPPRPPRRSDDDSRLIRPDRRLLR